VGTTRRPPMIIRTCGSVEQKLMNASPNCHAQFYDEHNPSDMGRAGNCGAKLSVVRG
jgi:hypothetical protein